MYQVDTDLSKKILSDPSWKPYTKKDKKRGLHIPGLLHRLYGQLPKEVSTGGGQGVGRV